MKIAQICFIVLFTGSALIGLAQTASSDSRRLGAKFVACRKKCLHAESFTKCLDNCKSQWGDKRQLLTFNNAKNMQCYNKFGYKAKAAKNGKIGGSPNYGTIKSKDKAKIGACIDGLNKPKVTRVEKKSRRLLVNWGLMNKIKKCNIKFGYPNITCRLQRKYRLHAVPCYGKINAGVQAKISACYKAESKPVRHNLRRRLTVNYRIMNAIQKCNNKFGYPNIACPKRKYRIFHATPCYGKIKAGDQAKISACVKAESKPVRPKLRRKLMANMRLVYASQNCHKKFGYPKIACPYRKYRPVHSTRTCYGKIKAEDNAKISACYEAAKKPRAVRHN